MAENRRNNKNTWDTHSTTSKMYYNPFNIYQQNDIIILREMENVEYKR